MKKSAGSAVYPPGAHRYIRDPARVRVGVSASARARCVQVNIVTESAVPQNVIAFIKAHIDSVLQLEILLLLQAQQQRAWSAAEIAHELRIDPAWTSGQLQDLAAAGLLAASSGTPPAYRYAPRTAELDDAVAGLASAYAARRVTVIGMIFSKPLDKIRSFADAFRIRKDKDKPDG